MYKIVELRDFNIKTGLGIKLAYVAYLELNEGVYQNSVTHNISEIMAVKSGKGIFNVDNVKHTVYKNDFFIVNADTLHNEEGLSQNFGVYIIGLENYSLEGKDGEMSKPYTAETDRICYYAEQIIKDYERGSREFYENSNLLFSLIINEVLENTSKIPKPNVKRGSNELINTVTKYLDGHFSEDISIKLLAEKFFINKTTLMHSFKRYKGVSIMEYVLYKRLEESKNWLKISNMTVAEISERCNFSTPSYYVQYFKKVYGITPIRYRKQEIQNKG